MTRRKEIVQIAASASLFSLVSNSFLVIVKWLTGIFGNSYALIADAIESTADVFSSLLLMLGLRYAQKPADENHPYGHGRLEGLLTFGVVGLLLVTGAIIAWQSIRNILTPHQAPEVFTLYVLAVIILWKEVSYRSVRRKAAQIGSSALLAEAWHHRADAVSSVTAFIGIFIAVIGGDDWAEADDYAALIAVGVIYYNAYRIFRPALGEIMDENMYDTMIGHIRRRAGEVSGILGTEKCFVRKSGVFYFVDLHIEVHPELSVREGHTLAHNLQRELQNEFPQIERILIHVEPFEEKTHHS